MIATRDGEAVSVHPVRNEFASPLRYKMDPQEQYRVWDEIESSGCDVGVIYHSHTRSDPIPSQTDINLARTEETGEPLWPGTLYLIVGVKSAEDDLRLWSIVGDRVEQVELQVVG
jgi:[CysO sulfur-carrier protein]-S-L-cysteine hydrolase